MNYEISQTNDEERKQRLRSLVSHASEFVPVERKIHARAKEIQEQLGVKTYDALHLACAEQGKANVLLSTDDKLIRAAKRNDVALKVEVENPLVWLQKMVYQ
jgi:predicted nucleic acid-binding protein